MNIGKLISIIHRKKQQYIKDKMKELDLDVGISDYQIILFLNSKGKQGTTKIANTFAITKSQVSQSVRKLEKLGYIVQERDPEHRNKVIINITSEGLEVAKILKKILKSWHEIAREDISKEEMKGLYDSLLKVAFNVSEEDITSFVKKPNPRKRSTD